MPLPTPPTILLAAGGLAMVSGRFLSAHSSVVWGWYFVLSLTAAAGGLLFDPVTLPEGAVTVAMDRIWINDPLAVSQQWLVLLFGLFSGLVVSALTFRKNGYWYSYSFLLFALAGLMLVARANDLLALGMAFEIVTIAVVALGRCFDTLRLATDSKASTEISSRSSSSLHWLLSVWMWLGIALLSNAVVTTQFDAIRKILIDAFHDQAGRSANHGPSKLILLAAGLIVMSLSGRMGLVPFHLGHGLNRASRSILPWGFEVLAGQLAGCMALCRLCGHLFVGLGQPLVVMMTVVTLASFFWSSLMAVRGFLPGVQSIPRWLTSLVLLQSAWLGIGLMVITLELEHPDARWGAFPQQRETLGFVVYSQFAVLLTSAGLFGILGHLARADRGVEFLEDLKGLGQIAPWIAVPFFVSLASAIGSPWTAGFWGRWLVMLSGQNVHLKSTSSIFVPNDGLRFVLLIGMIATIVNASVVIRIFREMFFESPLARSMARGGRVTLTMGLSAACATLLLGIAPTMLLTPLSKIQSPRVLPPEIAPQGSGNNRSAFQIRWEHSSDF